MIKALLFKVIVVMSVAYITWYHYEHKKGFDNEAASSIIKMSKIGGIKKKPAPSFAVRLNDEELKYPEDLKGKVILLNFWAVWCKPCAAEIPALNKVYNLKKTDTNFVFIGVVEGVPHNMYQTYKSKNKMNYPSAMVSKKVGIMVDFAVTSYPTTVIIGKNGKIKLYETGVITNPQTILEHIN